MANMTEQDKIAKLKSAMSRASKLMQLESNGTLDKIAKSHKGEINASLGSDSTLTTENIMSTPKSRNTQAPMVSNRMTGASADKVPSIIRESFMKNPISEPSMYSALGDGRDLSFLDEGVQSANYTQPSSEEIRNIVNEGVGYTAKQVVSQQVDYPMIRTIVEEIVRKYASSLKNKLLQENNGNEVNTISLGKNFKFLANDGTIYECTMKKIGTLNKKNVIH